MKLIPIFLAILIILGVLTSCERQKVDTPLPLTQEDELQDTLPSIEADSLLIEYESCPLPACEQRCLNASKPWLYLPDSCRKSPMHYCPSNLISFIYDSVRHYIMGIDPINTSKILLMEIRRHEPLQKAFRAVIVDICDGSKHELPLSLQNHSEYTLGANDWVAFRHVDQLGIWKSKINGDSLQPVNTDMLGRLNDQVDRKNDSSPVYSPDGMKLLFSAFNVGKVIVAQNGGLVDSFHIEFVPYGWSVDGTKIYAKYNFNINDDKLGYFDLQSRKLVEINLPNPFISGTDFGPGPKPELMIWEKFEQLSTTTELMMLNIQTGESSLIRKGIPGQAALQQQWFSAPDGSFFCMSRGYTKELDDDPCIRYGDYIPHFFASDCSCEIMADFD